MFLLFLELLLFCGERLEDGAQLMVSLFKLVLLESKASVPRPRRLPGIALISVADSPMRSVVELNPVGCGIGLVSQFLNPLARGRNLFFKEINLLALFAYTKLLRFNLFLQRSLNVAEPLNFFLGRRDRQMDFVMRCSD